MRIIPLAIPATLVAATIFALSSLPGPGKAADEGPSAASVPPLPTPTEGAEAAEGTEVLTRGPVHEAFATPVEMNPQAGPIMKKEPPPAIEEVPPDQRPEGDNVVWIPGYFAWDDERNDYIWISGVWRNIPPGQTWVAGYWNKAAEGYQWTPGFWTAAKTQQVSYLAEAPPVSQEIGPNAPAPSENHFWIPGNYVYQEGYRWQPGYWAVAQPNWIWMPAHYVWTPGGYVFIPGYWDYAPAYRGALFAPVYFSPVIYRRPHFVFAPGVVINVGFFSANLFVRPAFSHYYFGDFYATQYAGLGIRPFFEVNIGGRGGYDPLFNYYRWKNVRTDPNWVAQQRQHFETLQKNAADRPPRTFLAQEQLAKKGEVNKNFLAGATLQQAAKEPGVTGFKMQPVSMKNREEFFSQAQNLNKVSQERFNIESQGSGSGKAGLGGVTKTVPAQKLTLPTMGTQAKLGATTSQENTKQQFGAGGNQNEMFRQRAGLSQQTEAGNQGSNKQPGLGETNAGGNGPKFGRQNQGFSAQPQTGEKQPSTGLGQPGNLGNPNVQFGQQSGAGGVERENNVPQGKVVLPGNSNSQGNMGQPNVNPNFKGPQGPSLQRIQINQPQQQKKDKDDDPNKKNNHSDTTSPSTNFSMQRTKGASGINVGGVVDSEKAAMQRDIADHSENWAKEALNDKLTNDKQDVDKPTPPPATRSTVAKPQLPLGNAATGLSQPGYDRSNTAQGSNGLNGSNEKGNTTRGFNSPSGTLSGVGQGPDARSGLSPSATAGSSSIYRNLLDRGRSLSQPGAAANVATGATPGGGDNGVDPRLKKDPIGSYGYGSTPTRFPGIASPYGYSAQGSITAGPSAGGYNGNSGGLGTIPHYTPNDATRTMHGFGPPPAAASSGNDAQQRTYDPNQQPSNTYGAH